jgi:hypothetical protein
MITKKKLFRVFPTIVIYFAVVISFMANFIDISGLFVTNTIGYSILFNLIIIYFLKKLKYCCHTIIAMCNLIVLNVFNILNAWNIIDYNTYYLTYDLITLAIMFLIMLIYSVKK